jgi:Ser/Thr protein kinase RdoA (MazF antagonist)
VNRTTDLGPARAAAERFGWDAVEVVVLTDGHINDSYLVRCDREEYVLQRLNRSVFPDPEAVSANTLAVHRHLGGGLVPDPVPAPDGGWLLRDGGETWRAARRVPSAAPCPELTPEAAGQAGSLLGRFHVALADLDPAQLAVTLPGFHDLRSRLDALVAAIGADPCGRAESARPDIEAALDAEPLVEVAEDLVRKVPVRVAHHDVKLDNILFRKGEAVCVVDLDTLMPGQWFWDVGDLLRTASTTAAEDSPDTDAVAADPVLYDAVLTGYLDALPDRLLTRDERAALSVAGAIATYEQGMRFLTDWLVGDRYFRTHRPGQNLDRARTQLRLLSTLPGRRAMRTHPTSSGPNRA